MLNSYGKAIVFQANSATAELALERAKLVANQKARRADLTLPYAEAGL